jgi:hypothetical protein
VRAQGGGLGRGRHPSKMPEKRLIRWEKGAKQYAGDFVKKKM